jgi:hypothetical protein
VVQNPNGDGGPGVPPILGPEPQAIADDALPAAEKLLVVAAGLPHDWGSSSHSRFGGGIGFEELSEAGSELAVEAGAADLEQAIGTMTGPSHLL